MLKYVNPEPDPSPEQPTEKLFEFHYVPDEGVLPGLIFEQQTEDVINDIGNYAYFTQKTASKALKTGLEASKAARTALNSAQNAQSTADRATELANTGISKANAAQETASKALKKAETNEVGIAANSSSIATLQNTVNGQQTQLDGNLTNISELKKRVAENKQRIDGNSNGISQCIIAIQKSQRYTTTDKTDANDLTDYGRIYLPNALLHCPSGVTYPVLFDVVPFYLDDYQIDDVLVQRVVDANGVSFYRLATETTVDATTTYTFSDWKSIDTRYLKLTGGTVTGQTTFSGKLTASGETSVPTPSTANNSKTIANTEFVHGVVSDLVNGAPGALNTLQELANALGNDPNFATTVLNKIGEKESKTDAQIEYKKLQDAIPTKVSQLSNDSGYQKTAEIPLASQTQNGYMSASDKAKLDEITEGSTDVKDYVKSVTESNGRVIVTKGNGDSTTFNAGLNILARNKAYAVGDIAYSSNLPSYLYLECTTEGTTGATEPDMSTLSGGAIVNDGTAKFSVKTVCAKEYVDSKSTDEAKKWKNAYNNLRKRSTPAEFDDAELTVLCDDIYNTDIKLSQPYTDFDGLLFDTIGDDNEDLTSEYISVTELNRRVARAKIIPKPSIFIIDKRHYWTIFITKNKGFSPTLFPHNSDNCTIIRIWGVKFKEIT
jgi:hypothetical protein